MKQAAVQFVLIVTLTIMLTSLGGMLNILKPVIFCSLELINKTSSTDRFNQLKWIETDKYKTANILAAFLIGLPTLILPAGIITLIFKNKDKIALAGFMLGQLICTIPEFALAAILMKGSYLGVFGIRLIQGIGTGLCYAYFIHCVQIITPHKWLTMVFAVTVQMLRIGAVLDTLIEAKLCSADKWLINIYIWPALGIFCMIVWAILIYSFKTTPIAITAIPRSICQKFQMLMRKREIYFLAFASFITHANTILYFSYLPKYFIDVYDLPLSRSYVQSVVPNFIACAVIIILSFCVELLTKKFSTGLVLKISNTLATTIVAAMLILMLLKLTNDMTVVVLQTIGCCGISFLLIILFRGLSECLPKAVLASSIVSCLGTIGYLASSYMITLVPSLGDTGWPIVLGTFGGLQVIAAAAFLFVPMPSTEIAPRAGNNKISTMERTDCSTKV